MLTDRSAAAARALRSPFALLSFALADPFKQAAGFCTPKQRRGGDPYAPLPSACLSMLASAMLVSLHQPDGAPARGCASWLLLLLLLQNQNRAN